ncbi:lipopolysaccharide biosynthesis protein [Rothia nasimurium]|uniref:lipopolysaccharide biosynthesis protein n=1 Tax=Rothia nasimurium TaxID=85336 RepID=UPI00361F4CEB
MAERTLAQRGARGGANAVGGQLAKIVINLVSLAILARLISPEEYGLVAMVMAVMAIADVFRDFGLTSATIQAKTISPQERSNLWWLNTTMGVVVAAVIALLAPVVAAIYSDDRLILITLVMSLNFVISGMSTQYFANLQREIQFGKIAVNNIISNIIGLIAAVIMALNGFGVWSLVFQGLVIAIASLLIFIIQTRWIPGGYDRSVSMRRFLNFGMPLMFSNLLNYFSSLVDVYMIGHVSGPEVLGYFNRSSQAVRTPLNSLRSPLNNVAFSTLSKKQSSNAEIATSIEKGQILLAYPLTLIAGGLAAASSSLVVFFLGESWQAAAPFFAWIAITEGLNCLAMTAGWIFLIRGKSKGLMNLTIFSSINRTIFVIVGALVMGPLGAVVGQAVAVMIQWPLSLLWVQRSTGVSTKGLLVNSYRIFAVVLFSSALNYYILQGLTANLITSIILGVVLQLALAAICAVIPAVRRDYMQILEFAKSLTK